MAGLAGFLKKVFKNINNIPDKAPESSRSKSAEPVITKQQNPLRQAASKNFDRYLNEFLTTGETHGLPNERLTESEWKRLNEELKDFEVMLVPHAQNGYVYYWFEKLHKQPESLKNRASKNFDKYLNEFLTTGETHGLPNERLTESEWKKLNEELKSYGVELVPHAQNGYVYYWFVKQDKTAQFNAGKTEIENKLIEDITKKYPGISTITVLEILRSKGALDPEDIYKKIRYKQDGHYADVSKDDFENAFEYALESAENKQLLFSSATRNHWNPNEYKYCLNTSLRRKTWPNDRSIFMSGTQHWTWFRSCSGDGRLQPVSDKKNPNGFHISLNVNVVKDLLAVLDDILIEDGGRYIHSYKFPKTNYYDEILTRHDPVTIYINARNPELEKKIVKAVAPFIRSNDGMIGESLGKGVCINGETSNGNGGISVGETIARDIIDMIVKSKYRE